MARERVHETGGNGSTVAHVVEELCTRDHGIDILAKITQARRQLPSQTLVIDAFEHIRSALFPGYFGITELTPDNLRYHVGADLDYAAKVLRDQVRRGLCYECGNLDGDCPTCPDRADRISQEFLESLPGVRQLLAMDVQAAYESDPAATSPDEAIFCYPGIYAITSHRVAHELYSLKVPLIPRIISEHAHSVTGIDIHPGARIGKRFFIDHGTGVVIGETCVIGDNVRLFQGVTLGAKRFELDENGKPVKGIPRHPIVEDDVVVYSGATILGRITIGRGAVIGGNVWVDKDVPRGGRVTLRADREG